ncbi:hypothetical protein [Streptomyces sp. NPDC089799]|uniref:hypothetical protein n=1 Tax=Streptomyces sp. NPDC089799 TaxID=3155066 RepID=UPI00342ED5E3
MLWLYNYSDAPDQRFGPHAATYYHGGELPGFNSFIGHDPENRVTLVVWTNLTVSPDGRTTANALLPTVLNRVYPGLDLPTGTGQASLADRVRRPERMIIGGPVWPSLPPWSSNVC